MDLNLYRRGMDGDVREVADRAIATRNAVVAMRNPQSRRGNHQYRGRSCHESHLLPSFAAPGQGHQSYYRAAAN